MSKPFDNRVLGLVRQAMDQGHKIDLCPECQGPRVHSLDRLGTHKCLACGAFRGQSRSTGEHQPFKLPYTMTAQQRLDRYYGPQAPETPVLCDGCGKQLSSQRRVGMTTCSPRCRQRVRRARQWAGAA